jgi:hypothetical protein
VGKHEGRNHLENLSLDGSIILELYSRGGMGGGHRLNLSD